MLNWIYDVFIKDFKVAVAHFKSAMNAYENKLNFEACEAFKRCHERAIGALEIFHQKENHSDDFTNIKTCVQVYLDRLCPTLFLFL